MKTLQFELMDAQKAAEWLMDTKWDKELEMEQTFSDTWEFETDDDMADALAEELEMQGFEFEMK